MPQKALDMIEMGLAVGLRGKPLRYVLKNDLGWHAYQFVEGGADPEFHSLATGGNA